jgi:hypothetical protein
MTSQPSSGLYEQLKDDLGYLKLVRAAELLPGLLDRARDQQLSHAAFLAELVAEEAAATRNRRMAARLGFAHFPVRRTLAEFDFDFQPSVDPKLVDDLASLRFVAEGHPLLLLGQPGCGKSHCESSATPRCRARHEGHRQPSLSGVVQGLGRTRRRSPPAWSAGPAWPGRSARRCARC